MYLKALEIQGFKSFAEKTRLTFEKDITAIVGPNGSGKSNISDAILWVMGEQRTKALRGTKMEDVIFGGTAKRAPLGYASVTLIIDNSAHIFDSDLSEIALTRRYYRSGESEYLINKETVRLKDINSLLMDTGLGRDGYSIIGQGRIAEIVSTKSTDRREVFEEAAGISRFRYRKEEAERKLEKTDENLLRINDKIEELEMQVGPLKKQAETAKKYLALRDELKIREISVWMESLDRLAAQSEAIRLEYEQINTQLEKSRAELEALYLSSDSLTDRMHRKDEETELARERLSAAEAESAEREAEIAVLEANIKSSAEATERLLDDIAQQETRTKEIEARIASGAARTAEINAALKEEREKDQSNQNVLSGCRMKLQSRDGAFVQLTEKYNDLTVTGRSMDSRINMLTEMEKEFEGFSKAVKTVMKEAQRGGLRGIRGPVANLIRTDDECALAIETALGGAAQDIIVDTQSDGRAAIELLKRRDAGRGTFMPLDVVRGSVMKDAPVNAYGFVGVAYDLVQFDEKYSGVIAKLLGRTVVAESLPDAIKMSNAAGGRLRIVTLDGQMINEGGSMTGGSAAKGTGAISRTNELEKLKKDREKLRSDEKDCAEALDRAKRDIAGIKYQLDMAQADQLEIRSAISSLEAEARTTTGAVDQLRALLENLTGDSEERKAAVEKSMAVTAALEKQRNEKVSGLAGIAERIEAAKREIADISADKLELESRRVKAERETQRLNNEMLELQSRAAKTEQKKLSADMEEKQIIDKLWDSYELSHTAANALRRPIENFQKASKDVSDLRRQISALGSPNLGAIDEFERVNTRYEFLAGQRDDVEKARGELLKIIGDITSEMKTVFMTQLRAIDEAFRGTFLELFGGGKAAIVLEDEEDCLNCGIDIKAQPPGKNLSAISLLSGGEKAFVAIALYFAILKVRPTPFCVMDEIEAALDEANVTRYADYMRRMADRTQFLVITHRRGTMEEADMLYGVTMQEKGVSTVIELDLENAKKTIEE